MKARILFLAFFLIVAGAVSSAQVIIDEKGLYHNEDNELYTGTYIEFYPNGNKRIELSLNQGIIHGPVTLYFESGERKKIRSYSNGEKTGLWKMFDEIGNLVSGVKHD